MLRQAVNGHSIVCCDKDTHEFAPTTFLRQAGVKHPNVCLLRVRLLIFCVWGVKSLVRTAVGACSLAHSFFVFGGECSKSSAYPHCSAPFGCVELQHLSWSPAMMLPSVLCRIPQDEPILHPLCHQQHGWCNAGHGRGIHGPELLHLHSLRNRQLLYTHVSARQEACCCCDGRRHRGSRQGSIMEPRGKQQMYVWNSPEYMARASRQGIVKLGQSAERHAQSA
eukprot:1157375-Pelagomonas_calceolata.AAC.12